MEQSITMSSTWTAQQILALAPDASSAKSGQGLASAGKWVTIGHNDIAAWGECQGSGSNPYQTQIDLAEPAFKCSCPSRKFPCKHAIGLFLLLAKGETAQGSPPAWAESWLSGRAARAEKQAEKAESAPSAPDLAAQSKRAAAREAKVAAGLAELRLWLNDLIRQGLADIQSRPYGFWDGIAARMVDAQAPGVARLLRNMAGIPASGPGWQDRMLLALGRLHLLMEGYAHIKGLPEGVQADIRTAIGWTQSQDELKEQIGIVDTWTVVGYAIEDEDRVRVERSWLHGARSGCDALVLTYTHVGQMADRSLTAGTVIDAELVYFPSSAPLRAIVKARRGEVKPLETVAGRADLNAAIGEYAAALAACPWIERYPLLLSEVVTVREGDSWLLRDAAGRAIPIANRNNFGWILYALSGGEPIMVFGEWDGDKLMPMSAIADGRLYPNDDMLSTVLGQTHALELYDNDD
jgi:hypothetical protein